MKISNLRLVSILGIIYLLSIIPMGAFLGLFRPLWLLLFVIYLQCTVPKQSGVVLMMAMGLMLDALGGATLGEQAFALLLTAWVVSKRARRFRLFSMSQQLFGVAMFSSLYQVILAAITMILGYPVVISGVFLPILVSVLCWPCLQYLCDGVFFAPVRKSNRPDVIKHNAQQ